ncbi:MAG: hypothetical protein WCO61_11995 [Alphaproteobacteria bacterium]
MLSVYAPEALIDGLSTLRESFHAIKVEERKIFEIVRPVTDVLDRFFDPSRADITSSLMFGSWARGTAIPASSDYNIAYELPRRLTENILNLDHGGAIAILALIDRLLREKFTQAQKSPESGSIKIKLGTGVVINLRPCIRNQSGGFAYPDGRRQGSWRAFDPHLAIEAFRKLDSVTRENLIFLCRAMRVWRERHEMPMSGILIDSLAYRFIEHSPYRQKSIRYQDCLFRDFLGFLAAIDPEQEWWHAPGSTEPVFRKGFFELKALEGFRLVQQAMELDATQQHRAAWNIWAQVLGDSYAII